jgi:hypothetical protein
MRYFFEFVKNYFEGRNDLIGAEIGVYRGQNAKSINDGLAPKLLFLIDCWEPEGEGWFDGSHREEIDDNFTYTFNLLKGNRNIVIVKGWSIPVSDFIKDEMFDFVYIDGNHCQLECKQDMLFWYPKVKIGGIFGGHDYNMDGVRISVSEVFSNKNIQTGGMEAGVDWWFVKLNKFAIANNFTYSE